jgi:hypothetical protein
MIESLASHYVGVKELDRFCRELRGSAESRCLISNWARRWHRLHLVRLTLPLLAMVAICATAGCTSTSTSRAHPSQPSRIDTAPAVPPSLKPSIPGVFRTGVQFCGDPYGITATTIAKTVPLLDCPGLADAGTLPSIDVQVGGQVLISGVPDTASLTLSPFGLTRRLGQTFVALRPGRTVITIHNYACAPPLGDQQPDTCPLVAIQAR